MMKKGILFLIFLGMMIALPKNVFALRNDNNVEMTQEQYNRLVEIFGEASVDGMSQEIFDIEKDKTYEYVGKQTIYVKSEYDIDFYGNVSDYVERLVTQEEYEMAYESFSDIALYGVNHETTYKKLTLKQYIVNVSSNGSYSLQFVLNNQWKIMPKVRSYDIIAFRFSNIVPTESTIWGQLKYSSSSNSNKIQNYDISSSGYNAPYVIGGFGISMKLPTSTSVINMESTLSVTCDYRDNTYQVFGTYQHASTAVGEAVSKEYIISSSGRGGVVKFNNSTVDSYYDHMQGVSISISDNCN